MNRVFDGMVAVQAERRSRAHVARLDLSDAQVELVDGQAHAARALWNLLHDYWTFKPHRFASVKDADEAIRQARRDMDWLAVLPAQAAQAVLKTYRQAWANFFNPRRPAGRPVFKARQRSRMAVDVPQARDLQISRLNRRWGSVNLPKIGKVRFRWTKDLPGVSGTSPAGRITGARLVREATGWHIVFRVEFLLQAPAVHAGPEVGIDQGIAVPLALSTGEHLKHGPWLTVGERARLRRLEQRAARQRTARTKGRPPSRRLTRTYGQIAGLRAKAKRRATDWQHKTTMRLADLFGTVVVEDLKIVNMIKSAKGTVVDPGRNVAQKRALNRAISGAGWGRTVEFLRYKTADRGGAVVKVPPHGTSRECHVCRTTTPGSRETQARFRCKNSGCGWIGNADTNAARNILHKHRKAAGQAASGRGDLATRRSAKRQTLLALAAQEDPRFSRAGSMSIFG